MTGQFERIWLASPHMSKEGYELAYIEEAFASNWLAPVGPNLDAFEHELLAYVGDAAAVALSSGTAGIHLALKAAGVKEGDIVLCQDLTFSASANPIIYLNATPVFIDSDEATWNMDPKLLEQALETYGDRVKAVVAVHLYGLPADLDPILELCEAHNVPLIEDAAESLGSFYKGKHTGTFGKFGIFSFNGNKIITTSGGGMVVSEDLERINKIRFWARQSRDPAPHYQHSELGYNYRLSNILAGMGRGQLKVLDRRIEKKTEIYRNYQEQLGDLPGVSFMPERDDTRPNYWLSVMMLHGDVTPRDVMAVLEEDNIESRPVWKPMHLQPFFEGYDYVGGTVGEELFYHGICLPSDTKMTDEDMDRVCDRIRSLW